MAKVTITDPQPSKHCKAEVHRKTRKSGRCVCCGHRTRRPSGLCAKCEAPFIGCTSRPGRHPRGGLDYTPEELERLLGLDAEVGNGQD